MILKINQVYGKKLRSMRLQKDYQQKKLAELIGLKSQQDYSKLENGRKHFNKKIIADICKVFEIPEEEFKVFGHEPELAQQQTQKHRETELKLIKALEDEIISNKIFELYKTKNRLEQELKILDELIQEKMSKKYLFFDRDKEKVYLCAFY